MLQEKKFDRNTFIGFALIALLFIGYIYINQPSKEEKLELERQEQLAKQKQIHQEDSLKLVRENQQNSLVSDSSTLSIVPKDYTTENSHFKISFAGKGGYISELMMKNFSAFDSAASDHKRPLYLIKDGNNDFNIVFKDKSGKEINSSQLAFTPTVQKTGKLTVVTMTAPLSEGNLEYVYSIADNYSVGFEIKSKNIQPITNNNQIKLNWNLKALTIEKGTQQETYWSQTHYRFKGTNDVEYELFGADKWDEKEPIDWVAFKQQFFSSVLSFDEGFQTPQGGSDRPEKDEKNLSKKYFFTAELSIANNQVDYKMQWDFVPLDYKMLSNGEYEGKDFDEIIPFGWGILGWINRHFFLNVFHWLAQTGIQYGWVIFLMTIVVKLVLSPIMYKQYRQSAMMRILRPEMNEINEKYKGQDNAMKRQQANMELYRKAGVNPLSGCLPAVIQIPIFYALFRFFPNVIDLRGKPFLWAEDLTAYDSPITLPSWVPFMDGHLSILALAYIIAMVVYFKVSGSMDTFNAPPQEGMPDMRIMKYMMYVMPIFFFVFLNNYASGLSWYYLVSNVINIGIVMFIKNVMIDDNKIHAKIQENKAKPKKQSKFSQKMQQLMEQAQEAQKQQDQQKKKKK